MQGDASQRILVCSFPDRFVRRVLHASPTTSVFGVRRDACVRCSAGRKWKKERMRRFEICCFRGYSIFIETCRSFFPTFLNQARVLPCGRCSMAILDSKLGFPNFASSDLLIRHPSMGAGQARIPFMSCLRRCARNVPRRGEPPSRRAT
jgi:hypothetical protein